MPFCSVFRWELVRAASKKAFGQGFGGLCLNNLHFGSAMDGVGKYRYVATSAAGFIQQLAVSYLAHGYFFYVMGYIPDGKDPEATDKRILEKYDIASSKFMRYRRKESGRANLQYLRHERTFVILATHGEHRFFEAEAANIRDARRVPIKFRGYAVSFRGGHASVRIERETFKGLKAYFEGVATKRTVENLFDEFAALPFEPYGPVRFQFFRLLRLVNKRRQLASLSQLPQSAVRARRRIVSPFHEFH